MITHILKDGTTRKDMDGYLVSREACPTAYRVMEGMNDNSRKTATRKETNGQVQGESKACQV